MNKLEELFELKKHLLHRLDEQEGVIDFNGYKGYFICDISQLYGKISKDDKKYNLNWCLYSDDFKLRTEEETEEIRKFMENNL
jgi:hypothetical protein